MMGTICFGIHMHKTFELAIKIADIAKAAKAGNVGYFFMIRKKQFTAF